MAYTTADRDAVKAAMLQMTVTGRAQEVRYSDGSGVTYSPVNVAQMQAVLALIERDIATTPSVVPGMRRPIRAIRMAPRSGY